MHQARNFRYLRQREGLTQEAFGALLGLKRPVVNSYENGVTQPPIEVLVRMARQFGLTLDELVMTDLSGVGEEVPGALSARADYRGTRLRVLATTVGPDNVENIELVPLKVVAGYSSSYTDPDYIEQLPSFRLPLPGLSTDRKYRLFPIEGDSMRPIPDGSYVLGEYVTDWTSVKDGTCCVVVLQARPVFKCIENRIARAGTLRLTSLNPDYEPYEVPASDVLEIWKFKLYLTQTIPETQNRLDLILTDTHQIKRMLAEAIGQVRNGDAA